MSEDTTRRVVAVNRGAEDAAGEAPRRGLQHEALEAWVGRWINEGHLIDEDGGVQPDHRVQTVLHERTDDGATYVPSMRVTLVKVG